MLPFSARSPWRVWWTAALVAPCILLLQAACLADHTDALVETIAAASGHEAPESLRKGGGGPGGAFVGGGFGGGMRATPDWTWFLLWALIALLGMATVGLIALVILRGLERRAP